MIAPESDSEPEGLAERPAGIVTRGLAAIVDLLWVTLDRRRRTLQDIVFSMRVVYSRPAAR